MNASTKASCEVAGIVLAGGRSSRMGRNKAFLEVGGRSIIKRVLDVLSPITSEQVIVARTGKPYKDLGVPVVLDKAPAAASMVGIYSGLLAVKAPYGFCVACDMPFLHPGLMRYMMKLRLEADVVVPATDGHYHTLHALYAKSCLEPLKQHIASENFALHRLLKTLTVRTVTEEELAAFGLPEKLFFNANTPQDLARAHELVLGE